MEQNDAPDVCPHCDRATSTVALLGHSPRVICGRFGCDWDGVKIDADSVEVTA